MPDENVYPITRFHISDSCPVIKNSPHVASIPCKLPCHGSKDNDDDCNRMSDDIPSQYEYESNSELSVASELDDNVPFSMPSNKDCAFSAAATAPDDMMMSEADNMFSTLSTAPHIKSYAHILIHETRVKVKWDCGWLWDENASELVFFPGPDNRQAIHQIPAPLRRLAHQINCNKVTPAEKNAIMESFNREHRSDAVLCTCGSCGIRKYSNVRHDGRDVLRPKQSIQTLSGKKILADSIKELQEILKEVLLYEGEKYHLMLLSELSILELDEDALVAYNKLENMYKPAVSTYSEAGIMYHLHSDFIQKNEKGQSCVWICDSCNSDIVNNIVPELSIAGKRDFGRTDRVIIGEKIVSGVTTPIYLPKLSILELLVLSSARPFGVLISLTTNSGGIPSGKALLGHVIFFAIDALSKSCDILMPSHQGKKAANGKHTIPANLDGIPDILKLTFLGTEAAFEQKILNPMTGIVWDLSVDAKKILPWCKYLRAFKPDLIEIDEIDMQGKLDSVRSKIMENAHVGSNEIDKEMYHNLESNHAAAPIQVKEGETLFGDARYLMERNISKGGSLDNSTQDVLAALKQIVPKKPDNKKFNKSDDDAGDDDGSDKVSNPDSDDIVMKDKDKTVDDQENKMSDDDVITGKSDDADSQPANSTDQSKKKIIEIIVDQSTIPLSMFTQRSEIFYWAFPTLFPLQKGLGCEDTDSLQTVLCEPTKREKKNNGPLSAKEKDHLLHQFNKKITEDPFLPWALYDADHILKVLGQSSSRVKYDPESISTILKMVNSEDDDFAEKIDRCVKFPESDEAKSLVKLVTKHMVIAGSTAPHSAMMRDNAKSLFININKYFGSFSIFATSSPLQEQMLLTFRETQKSTNNQHFPATVHLENINPNNIFTDKPETKLVDALLNSNVNPNLTVNIDGVQMDPVPITPSDLYKYAVGNATAAADVFKLTQDAVLKYILGCPIFQFKNQAVPLNARIKGVFGKTTVAPGVLEAQARGWLHLHLPMRSGLTPNLLNHVAECRALVEMVSKIIDSYLTSELDRHVHLDLIKQKALGEPYTGFSFLACASYIPKSKKQRENTEKEKAFTASLRASIMDDKEKNLQWGFFPFLCEVVGCTHPYSHILAEAFPRGGLAEPLHGNLSTASWKSLILQMKNANMSNEETGILSELRSKMLVCMDSALLPPDLIVQLKSLFPSPTGLPFQIRQYVENGLKRYVDLKVVYGFKKSMGFQCTVMQRAASNCMHDHKPTCHKLPQGKWHCRMGFEKALCQHSHAVEIEYNDKKNTPDNLNDWKYISTHNVENPRQGIPVSSAPVDKNPDSYDFYRDPIRRVDARIIYFDSKRPMLKKLTDDELAAIKAEIQARDKKKSMMKMTIEKDSMDKISQHEIKIMKLVDSWERRNGLVVPHNDCYLGLIPGNQCIYFLGSMVQSQMVSHYLSSYLSKDKVEPSAILPIISSAFRKCRLYPSKAKDQGTPVRNTLLFIQKCTFLWAKQSEVSAQQAAAALNGLKSDFCSEQQCFVHVSASVAYVRTKFPQSLDEQYQDSQDLKFGASHDLFGIMSGPPIPMADDPSPTISANAGPVHDDPDASSKLGASAIISVGGKGDVMLLHEMYDNRGPKLHRLNLITYACTIKPVRLKQKDDADPKYTGQQANMRIPFADTYRLAEFYTQQISTNQKFPATISYSPCAPPPIPDIITTVWRRAANEYVAFYLTAFCPWTLNDGTNCALTYDNYVQFVRSLIHSNCIIDRANLEIIRSMSQTLNIDQHTKIAHQAYHHRNATVWTEEERRQHSNDEDLDEKQMKTAHEMRDLIQLIRDIFSLDEKSGNKDFQIAEYLNKIKENFGKVMNDHSNISPPVLPSIFSQSQTNKKFSTNMVLCKFTAKKISKIFKNMKSKEIQSSVKEVLCNKKIFQERYAKHVKENKPNAEQQALIDIYTAYFKDNSGEQPLYFLHAAGGAGKTFTANFLQILADLYGGGHLSTSIMGVACNQLGGGAVTLDSILQCRKRQKRKQTDNNDQHENKYGNTWFSEYKALGPLSRAAIDNQIIGKSLLIIDEISVQGPVHLALLDQHLRDVRNDQRPFGGMATLLIGDFFQLSSLFSESFYTVMMRNFVTHTENRADCHLPQHAGCLLFMKFIYTVFHANNRTNEVERIENIEHMRDPSLFPPINQKIIRSLAELTRDDIVAFPHFRFACMLVPGNVERGIYNYVQMKPFAIATNQVIIRWQNCIKEASSNPGVFELLYSDGCVELWSYYLQGAPGFLLFNYCVPRGVSNGPGCIYHSLVLGDAFDAAETAAIEKEIADTKPGEIVTLEKPPYAINIYKEIKDTEVHLWNENNTVLRDLTSKQKWVVIPLT